MKKYLADFAVCASLLALWACGGKDNPVTPGGGDTPQAPTAITLSTESISAQQGGGEFPVTVTAPQRPSVSAKPDWVTVVDGTYNKDTYKITLTLKVAAYGDYGERTGDVTVKSGSLTKTLTITQQGREKPDMPDTDIAKNLVTSGATTEAQALYNYLLANYGKRTLSGIMANVNWNHDEADKVGKAVGKYPALNCYDFIHILYSGANWINYSDITPVKEWADAGGIVALMWHFNVPKTPAEPGPVDGVTCTPSETTFKVANVFVDGSWEQVWFDHYVDQVADVILQLQEAGIAAIWRPFHEAAGNAMALQQSYWTKAWFWWGFDGPETYKKLWNRLQDAFYAKGIRNLIWVWTAQDYNGDPSLYGSDAAYYPGDDRVDIVGRDIYGKGADHNLQEFISAQTAYPKKMIALSENGKDVVKDENGKIVSSTDYGLMSDVWSTGALWSWFMPWYGDNMPSTAWWQDALNCENVITRDQVDY